MKAIVFCVLLTVATVSAHAVFTYADDVGGPKPIKKNVVFTGNGKQGDATEVIRLQGEEVSFVVKENGMNMVLDYGNNKVVFTVPGKKGVCYITPLSNELKKDVPLEKIRSTLESHEERDIKLEYPTEKVKINAKRYKVVETVVLGNLGGKLCSGLEKREVVQTTEVSTVLRGKREVGFWEVVVIVIVILVFL